MYPGSRAIARAWLRPQDRLIACEIEPRAADALARNMRGDPRIKTQIVDERDFTPGPCGASQMGDRHLHALVSDQGRRAPDALAKQLRRLGIGKVLRAELTLTPLSDPDRLNGCGVILVNPPWTLEGEFSALLPVLAQRLGRAGKDRSRGDFRLDWLAGERPAAAR